MKLDSLWDNTPANDNAGPCRPSAARFARVTVVRGGQATQVLVPVGHTGTTAGRDSRPVAT
jgi:hypothetical protein